VIGSDHFNTALPLSTKKIGWTPPVQRFIAWDSFSFVSK
jgi:hypothetical protein